MIFCYQKTTLLQKKAAVKTLRPLLCQGKALRSSPETLSLQRQGQGQRIFPAPAAVAEDARQKLCFCPVWIFMNTTLYRYIYRKTSEDMDVQQRYVRELKTHNKGLTLEI